LGNGLPLLDNPLTPFIRLVSPNQCCEGNPLQELKKRPHGRCCRNFLPGVVTDDHQPTPQELAQFLNGPINRYSHQSHCSFISSGPAAYALIAGLRFYYIGNTPITRTDEDHRVIFDEKFVRLCLWRFLYDHCIDPACPAAIKKLNNRLGFLRRSGPIRRSTYGFCPGDLGAIGRSRTLSGPSGHSAPSNLAA
jgi:hypothetical protein